MITEKLKKKSIFTHAHAIKKHPNFELIGAVDVSEKKEIDLKNFMSHQHSMI